MFVFAVGVWAVASVMVGVGAALFVRLLIVLASGLPERRLVPLSLQCKPTQEAARVVGLVNPSAWADMVIEQLACARVIELPSFEIRVERAAGSIRAQLGPNRVDFEDMAQLRLALVRYGIDWQVPLA
jgi:hypothetical protein